MKKIASLLLVGLAAGMGLWAGGTKQAGSGETSILVMPKLVGIPYFNASEKGAVQAGKDLGINVIYTGPTTADASEQVRMLEDFIAKVGKGGKAAICVAPNDAAALTPVLKKAKAAGIKVLDWDTSADQSVVDLSIHQIDDQQFGEHLWDLLVEGLGGDATGEYAILTGGLSAANLNTWLDYGQKYAAAKYPGLKLIGDKIPTDEKQQVAYQKTLDLITANPNLKGIVGVSTPTPIGAAQAVQEKESNVVVVGSALPTDSGPYLESGSLYTATLWDPAKLGYLTVVLANDLLNGKKPVDGQNVANVGKIQVKADGKTVIMGPPSDFTKANYKNFNF